MIYIIQILIKKYNDRIKYLENELNTDYAYYKAEDSRYADEREVELLKQFVEELKELKEIENE